MPAAERNVTAAVKQRILSGRLLQDNGGEALLGESGQVGSRRREESETVLPARLRPTSEGISSGWCVFTQHGLSAQTRAAHIPSLLDALAHVVFSSILSISDVDKVRKEDKSLRTFCIHLHGSDSVSLLAQTLWFFLIMY